MPQNVYSSETPSTPNRQRMESSHTNQPVMHAREAAQRRARARRRNINIAAIPLELSPGSDNNELTEAQIPRQNQP